MKVSIKKSRIKKINIIYFNERLKYLNSKEINEFLKLFIVCEYFYKTLIKLNHSFDDKKDIQIHLAKVKSVFNEIGYYNNDLLKQIFGSQIDSFKNFRNSIVHSISRTVSIKLIENHKTYNATMTNFINEIIKISGKN
jgi:hypothetical protein